MNINCTRRIQFCAGHRLMGHESKCAHLHGHNYVAFFHAGAWGLDSVGRVIDFSVLKERIGGWIDKNWDHGFIFHIDDSDTRRALATFENEEEGRFQKKYAMPYNPTAENMARYLLEEICPQVMAGTGVNVFKVVVWETENCLASAEASIS